MRLVGKVRGMGATTLDTRNVLRIASPLKRLCVIAFELSDPTALNASETIVLEKGRRTASQQGVFGEREGAQVPANAARKTHLIQPRLQKANENATSTSWY